jgi:hypothetical protein
MNHQQGTAWKNLKTGKWLQYAGSSKVLLNMSGHVWGNSWDRQNS